MSRSFSEKKASPEDWPEVPEELFHEKILNKEWEERAEFITEMLVQWRGLPDEEATWMSQINFQRTVFRFPYL